MRKIPGIVPISDLRQDAASVLKRVRSSREPLIITQRGRASAVMLSIDAYEEAEEERRILRALARGDREVQAGRGFSLESVLRDADRILDEEQSCEFASHRLHGADSWKRSPTSSAAIRARRSDSASGLSRCFVGSSGSRNRVDTYPSFRISLIAR